MQSVGRRRRRTINAHWAMHNLLSIHNTAALIHISSSTKLIFFLFDRAALFNELIVFGG